MWSEDLSINVPRSSSVGLRSGPLLHMRMHGAAACLLAVSEAAVVTPSASTLEVVATKLWSCRAWLCRRLVGECSEQHSTDRWQLGASMLDDRLETLDELERDSRFSSETLLASGAGRPLVKARRGRGQHCGGEGKIGRAHV